MSNLTESPTATPTSVQPSEPEFIAFIFPHLSMPGGGQGENRATSLINPGVREVFLRV
jgi:hypothetical protein